MGIVRHEIRVQGVVQGVGYRPFVHRLAHELMLSGWVGNDSDGVFIRAQGSAQRLAEFASRLRSDAPVLSLVTSVAAVPVEVVPDEDSFQVHASSAGRGATTWIPPDVATCDDCLREMRDPSDRRYRHPFITCTNCGPRFTIIRGLPYDRPLTTMAGFELCAPCGREYSDPSDRRYHAQPIACPDCGPQLRFLRAEAGGGVGEGTGAQVYGDAVHGEAVHGEAAVAAAIQALADGEIVAVKGLGGFHLACRADDQQAVQRLRARKRRGNKPFAIMARDLAVAQRLAQVSAAEAEALTSPARPIVLLAKLDESVDHGSAVTGAAPSSDGAPTLDIAPAVAPGNPELGVMLAYSPVHHLLLDTNAFDALVMTSANFSDEPLVYRADEEDRLRHLADAVLGHDRDIHVPCDDSVVRVHEGQLLPLRRARGFAPLPVPLQQELPEVLAVGGELKNTFALTRGRYALMSAHIGDMGSLETLRAFEQAVQQLSSTFEVQPRAVAADAHPGYITTGWAQRKAGDPILVQHHHAHIAAVAAEHQRLGERILGFAFDGTGYGSDGSIWGGEVLWLHESVHEFTRAGHLRPVPLIGGDAAVKSPARMALAYLHDAGLAWKDHTDLAPEAHIPPAVRELIRAQWDTAAAVPCTSMGRLFDAVSSILDICHNVEYEGQAAIELQAWAQRATASAEILPAIAMSDGVWDVRPLIRELAEQSRALNGLASEQREARQAQLALNFHEVIAGAVLDAADTAWQEFDPAYRAMPLKESPPPVVALSGGVFQNVLLLGLACEALHSAGYEVMSHRLVPPNDGGLALGQAVIAAYALGDRS